MTKGEIINILDNLCHNTMGNPPYRIDQALQAIKKVVEESDVAERIFRDYHVPLYDKNKPISEMTPYEQGMLKQVKIIASMVLSDIAKLFD